MTAHRSHPARWGSAALTLLLLAACDRRPPCVGVLLPETGAFEQWGREARAGLEMAWDEMDPQRRIRLQFVDNQSRDEWIPGLVGELVERHGATLILGPLTTGHARIASAAAASFGVPLLTPSATGEDVTVGNPWCFRLCYSDPQVAETLAHFARYDLKLQRLAVVLDLANSYSVGLAEQFTREFVRARGRIVAEVAYYSDPAELATVLDRVAALDVEGALIAEYHDNVVAMLAGAKDERLARLVLLGSDGWEGPALPAALEGRVRGAYYTSHFSPDESQVADERQTQVADFLRRHQDRFGGPPPSDFVALGYDAGRAVLSVFDPAADGAGMAERLARLRHAGITGRIQFDAEGDPIGKTMVIEQLHRPAGENRFVRRSGG